MESPYDFKVASLDQAKQVLQLTGRTPPAIEEMQFWYNTKGDLVMILAVLENQSEFASVQVVEVRRAIIDLYARRDFERFTYAPMMLTPAAAL